VSEYCHCPPRWHNEDNFSSCLPVTQSKITSYYNLSFSLSPYLKDPIGFRSNWKEEKKKRWKIENQSWTWKRERSFVYWYFSSFFNEIYYTPYVHHKCILYNNQREKRKKKKVVSCFLVKAIDLFFTLLVFSY
jgi:hypothetical protein